MGQIVDGLLSRGHAVDVLAAVDFPRWIMGEVRFTGVVPRWGALAPKLPGYDVINVHGPVPTLSDALLPLIRVLPATLRPPVVYTHHSNIELSGMRGISRWYNRFHERLTGFCDHVIVTSESYRSQVSRRSAAPCSVIPWGVDLVRFSAVERVGREPGASLRILFVGQMRPYKGIGELISAVGGVPGLTLTVAGGGALADRYRYQAAAHSNVQFAGFVDDNDLPGLYAANDVVALPSTTTAEAFGLVLLEGMAAGCVPLASELPGVRDLAGPSGLLVPPGDVVALRQALLDLGSDQHNLLAMQAAAVADSQRYAVDKVGERYEAVLMKATAEWQSRHAVRSLPAAWHRPLDALGAVAAQLRAESAGLLLFDGTRKANLRSSWGVDVRGVRDLPALGPRVVSRTQQHLITDATDTNTSVKLWRDHDGSSELHMPLRSSLGSRAVVSLLRGAHQPPWQDSDVARAFTALQSLEVSRVEAFKEERC